MKSLELGQWWYEITNTTSQANGYPLREEPQLRGGPAELGSFISFSLLALMENQRRIGNEYMEE